MKKTVWMGLAASLLISGSAYADRFVGMGVGSANIDDSANVGGTQLSVDDDDMGWKLYGGMMITDNFGFEAGWTDLGDINQNGVDLETEGFVAAGLASLPLTENLSLYAKAGVFFWDQDVNTVSFDGQDLMYGIGARLRFMDQFHVRLEWEQFDTKFQTDMISITGGVQF